MFTGIVQYVSQIYWDNSNNLSNIFTIKLKLEPKLGDSIAINGVCLTVARLDYNQLEQLYIITMILSETTINNTCFKYRLEHVNVEYAMILGDSYGGHIVSGHVDTVGKIINISENNQDYFISFDKKYRNLLRRKGSVTVDGISLTVAELYYDKLYDDKLYNDYFMVSIIPHTMSNTIINRYKIATYVNIEFDHYEKQWTHEDYMNYALELSEKYSGATLPNPHVGCVITNYKNEIIGSGAHEYAGKQHAEENAFLSMNNNDYNENNENNENKNKQIQEIEEIKAIYVTLEPCNHYGKRGPCCQLILKYKPKYVYIGLIDPNPLVSLKGIEFLKNNGFIVITGILRDKIRESLKYYVHYHSYSRPFFTGKIAMYLNNIYRNSCKERLMISNEKSLIDCHKLRSTCNGILVGSNTWKTDKPQLTVRFGFTQSNNYTIFVIDNLLSFIDKDKDKDKDKRNIIFVCFNKTLNNSDNCNLKNVWFCNSFDELIQRMFSIQIVHCLIEGGNDTLNRCADYLNEFIYYINLDYINFDYNNNTLYNLNFNDNKFCLKNKTLKIIKSENFDNVIKITSFVK